MTLLLMPLLITPILEGKFLNIVVIQTTIQMPMLLFCRFRGYWQGQTDEIMFEMHVPAAYYCPDGCGGGLSNNSNGTIYYYNHGTCIAQDTCQ